MKWEWLPAPQFAEIEPVWQDMNNCCAKSLLLDKTFVRHLILQFGSGREIIGICYHNNNPVAMGIFIKTIYGMYETFQPSQAPVGLWMASKDVPITSILKSLIKNLPGINWMVSILHQDPLISVKPENTDTIKTLDYINTSFVRIVGTFDDYWKSRSKNLRHNLKRQRNRLKKEGINTRLDIITRQDEIFQSVSEYGELETMGWKGKEKTNIHISNSQGKFYADMIKDFARENKALIFKYWYNDMLVSVDICIMDDETLIILKTTYDENQRTSSPAFLMLEEIVQYVFNTKKIQKIEFFGKVMDWHTKWIYPDDIRTMFHINYYRLKFIQQAQDTLSKLKYLTQNLKKQGKNGFI